MSIFSFPTFSATLTLPHTPLHLFFSTPTLLISYFFFIFPLKMEP